MANEIQAGVKAKIYRYRSGVTSGKGPWWMFVIKDDKGKNEITLFAHNGPFENQPEMGGEVMPTKIYSCKHSQRKGSDGVWRSQVTIEADVQVFPDEAAGGLDDGDEFGQLPWDEEF